jgi:hypothetical protein
MPVANTKVVELENIIYDYLIGLDEVALSPFLAIWPSKPFKTRIVPQRILPVLFCLSELVLDTNAETKNVVKMFKASSEHLSWGQTYAAEDFGAGFLKKYGWTELIGLCGPIKSKDIACGFLLLGPDIEYPLHSHEAEEVYVPLISQSRWIQGNDPWVSRPSGVPIYHKSWLPHGMRTESAPLLALYLWRGGDLAQKSHIG